MPTYSYACRDCGHTFDAVQSMADDALTLCPECGGELRKVFHPAGIAFKGSGFYATDSRKGSKSATKPSGGSEGGSGSTSEPAKGSDSGSKSGEGGGTSKGSEKSSEGSGSSDKKPAKPGKKDAS